MRLTNTSGFDKAELTKLIEYASRGCRDTGVEVHVKNTEGGLRGWCYAQGIPSVANVAKTTDALITLLLPPPGSPRWPKVTWAGLKRIKLKWPNGIPLESWQDAVVWLAAHEFRHVWQADREKRARKRGKTVTGKLEYDCEVFANERLNDYRVDTNRLLVPCVKQPNPFAKAAAKMPSPLTPTEPGEWCRAMRD